MAEAGVFQRLLLPDASASADGQRLLLSVGLKAGWTRPTPQTRLFLCVFAASTTGWIW